MKKFLALVCMITCIFGLTACGSEEVLTDNEQQKVDYATQVAMEQVQKFLYFADDTQPEVAETLKLFEEYTVEEIAYIMSTQYSLTLKDGYVFRSAVDSFDSALDEIGAFVEFGETSAKIDDDTIIVNVQVIGENKNAEAEVIISNDWFMVVESAALNPESTMGDLMTTAALNTLIGMGTVFVVLILISGIISCFAFIPKIQAAFSKKEEKSETTNTTGVENAVAQIATQEESVDVSDDLELVAVIAAAIAASEGAATADGFVVRSIRKVNRGRR